MTAPHRRVVLQDQLRMVFRTGEWVFTGLGLSVFAGGLFGFLVSPLTAVIPSDQLWRLAKAAVYLGSLGLLIARPRASWRTVTRHPATVVVIILALASSVWSVSPLITLKRAAVLAGTTLFGIYIASRFRAREFLVLVAAISAATAVASLALVYIEPERAIAAGVHAGDWVGVYDHKNALGLHMALGTLAFMVLGREVHRGRWLAWLGTCLCGLLLLRSHSLTSLVAAAAAVLVLPLLALVRRQSMGRIIIALGLLTLLGSGTMVVAASVDSTLTVLGKDTSMTGRLALWEVLIGQLQVRPWLGFGYGAFWTGWDGGPSEIVAQITGGWYPWHAHNGFLNLALQLGAVGVIIFLFGYVSALLRSVALSSTTTSTMALWPILLLVFLLVASVSETMFLKHDDLFTLLYVATVFLESGDRALRRGSSSFGKVMSLRTPGRASLVPRRNQRRDPAARSRKPSRP